MSWILTGVVALFLVALFWAKPGAFEWLDDQTNMRGVNMSKRLGYKNDPGAEFHERRRVALRRILIAFGLLFGVMSILAGIASTGR